MTIALDPFQLLTWWGCHTNKIRLGTAVAVAPYWHPIRLAGEAALQRWFTDQFRAASPAIIDQVRQWVLANRKEVYAPIYQALAEAPRLFNEKLMAFLLSVKSDG